MTYARASTTLLPDTRVPRMASGVAWNEDYADPKSDVARISAVTATGGSLALVKYMGALPRVAKPGEKFNYNTGETHLAGAIVRAAIARSAVPGRCCCSTASA